MILRQQHSFCRWNIDSLPAMNLPITSDLRNVCQRYYFYWRNFVLLLAMYSLITSDVHVVHQRGFFHQWNNIRSPAIFALFASGMISSWATKSNHQQYSLFTSNDPCLLISFSVDGIASLLWNINQFTQSMFSCANLNAIYSNFL
jgi:hypothetical protein